MLAVEQKLSSMSIALYACMLETKKAPGRTTLPASPPEAPAALLGRPLHWERGGRQPAFFGAGPQGNLRREQPHTLFVPGHFLLPAVHPAVLHQLLRDGQWLWPGFGAAVHEREVLYAAVMRALEEIQQLHQHTFEFRDSLVDTQISKRVDGVLHASTYAPNFPVPMQGTSPARFQLASRS